MDRPQIRRLLRYFSLCRLSYSLICCADHLECLELRHGAPACRDREQNPEVECPRAIWSGTWAGKTIRKPSEALIDAGGGESDAGDASKNPRNCSWRYSREQTTAKMTAPSEDDCPRRPPRMSAAPRQPSRPQ